MIQQITIDEELQIRQDEQLCKLLMFSFFVLNQLIKNISASKNTVGDQSAPGGGGSPQGLGQEQEDTKRKILYVVKTSSNLDPNLKFFLNSLKTALLMRTISMRLVIIEDEKIVAGQEFHGQKVEGAISKQIFSFTDLAHFLSPF
jgi:hypothetical protein